MNRTKIKNYAPQARRDFLQAVMDRATFYGLTAERIEPVTTRGDVAIIGGRAFPRAVADKRRALLERVERDGYGPTMEALAYTWFNRLVAIRYMELHGYFEHGFRVLSNLDPAKAIPEILDQAEHVELADLKRERVIELKLDGSKEAELYRMLLVAQCNALHSAMPFLFERIGDETELVLPESLLHSDSIVRKLVSSIDEEDWHEVEIVGWLYEGYISEQYEAVIGSVVASVDIPAATQRFTPKWIVRYLVQNTQGRLWLATYPQSPLKGQMKYYIEPAEQTPEVQEQLRAITPTSLNPEEITFLDPACGSAHILVEAYDLFKAIYQERGYRAKDIPRLILTKNLFGLEIDDRAAQLAAFALMMKARADDRRIFNQGVQPQIRALVQTDGMDADDIAAALNVSTSKETPPSGQLFETEDNLFTRAALATIDSRTIAQSDVKALIAVFEHAKTFGSLIQVPPALAARLTRIEQRCQELAGQTGEIASRTVAKFLPVIEQAKMLAGRYDCVVANPPYMGSKYYNSHLKSLVNKTYKNAKGDLYACFIQRNFAAARENGFVGMITIPNWMFLSSFEDLRKSLFTHQTIETFLHNGRGVFGSDFGSCSLTSRNVGLPNYRGTFRRLFDKQGSVSNNELLELRFSTTMSYTPSSTDFSKIPGSPVAYWVSDAIRGVFTRSIMLGAIAKPRHGLTTGNNDAYIRFWHEVDTDRIGIGLKSRQAALDSAKTWFPYTKGGKYRRWYGNYEYVINYENNGESMSKANRDGSNPGFRHDNFEFYFCEGVTWSQTSIKAAAFRFLPHGFVIGHIGSALFPATVRLTHEILAFLNSRVCERMLDFISPTVGLETGHVECLPFLHIAPAVQEFCRALISLHKEDWDFSETSWDFRRTPLLDMSQTGLLSESWSSLCDEASQRRSQAIALETSTSTVTSA